MVFGNTTPRYVWRGLHLDVSRHFFTPSVIRELIDRMAALRLNRLHLHLTDGPGWRIEIKSYPRLTSVGAWRKALPANQEWNWSQHAIGNHFSSLYGGYYTQKEMRQLIEYAAERDVMIVPEIDLPGHSYAALVAYPEWCLPGYTPQNCQLGYDIVDVENPSVQRFALRVLDELMNLFPEGTPIHLGGDEVDSRILSKDKQRKFLQSLVDYLKQHGRTAITWDEAAMNGVRGQWVMLWRAEKTQEVLQLGLPTILCPCSHFYFDYPQRLGGPGAPGVSIITPEDIRQYPIPNLPHIIGLQGNIWTEYIRTREELMDMAFPRAEVLAEKAWGSPLPQPSP